MIEGSSGWALAPAIEREIGEARRGEIVCRRLGWVLFLALVVGHPLVGPSLPFLMVSGALTFAWARCRVREYDREVVRQRSLQREFADVDGCPVAITIRQRAAPTGYDAGIAWFEDGRLYFVGRRTPFGLGRGRVVALRDALAVKGLRSALTLDLRGGTSVGFDVVSPDETPAVVRSRLAESLRRWLADGGPHEGQAPTIAIGPDAPTAPRLLGRALGATGFWCAGSSGVFWAGVQDGSLGMFAATLSFLVLGLFTPEAWAPGLRWRAWHDRRRLA